MATKNATPPESVTATPSAPTSAPIERLSLREYLEREPRLTNRPEMRGAFVGVCQRAGLQHATAADFARQLDQLERGSR